jgi:hypothetical protein
MKILQTNKSKFIAMLTIILLALFSIAISAQDKDQTKSKLDQLKGKVDKITVKVDGKDIVFEGKEAEKLAKKLQKPGNIEIITDNIKEGKKKNISLMLNSEGDDKAGVKKKIQIEDKDGEKVVTVTTTKDGKDEIKTYKGEEADKFMKENNEKHFNVFFDGDDDSAHSKVMRFSLGDDDEGECCRCCCRHLNMKMMGNKIKERMKYMILKDVDENDKDKVKEEKQEKK